MLFLLLNVEMKNIKVFIEAKTKNRDVFFFMDQKHIFQLKMWVNELTNKYY